MTAARFWRMTQVETYLGGDLELSEVALYEGSTRVDSLAAITTTIEPVAGSLGALGDESFAATVRWDASAPFRPGFAIVWDFGAGVTKDISKIGVAGPSLESFAHRFAVEYLDETGVWVDGWRTTPTSKWIGAQNLWEFAASDADQYRTNLVISLGLNGERSSRTFFDSSPSPKTVSPAGNVSIRGEPSLFEGAAAYFDGIAGFLYTPCVSDFNMGTEDFTIRLQYFPISAVPSDRIFQTKDGDVVPGLYLSHHTSSQLQFYYSSNGSFQSPGLILNLTPYAWNPIEICKISGVVKGFVGGVWSGESYAVSGPMLYSSSDTVVIGGQSSGRTIKGYLADFEIFKGVGLHSSSFTPPPRGLSRDAQVLRLTRQSGLKVLLSGSTSGNTTPRTNTRLTPALDIQDGGMGIIVGTVKEKALPANTPLRRRVVLLNERDHRPVRETWSHPATGAYAFENIDPDRRYTVLSYDHTGQYRAVIADNLQPERMS